MLGPGCWQGVWEHSLFSVMEGPASLLFPGLSLEGAVEKGSACS